jgi:hypothetical protein
MEALAAGKAVVTSPLAVEGLDVLDGEHVALAETDEEFAGALLGLLADENQRVAPRLPCPFLGGGESRLEADDRRL